MLGFHSRVQSSESRGATIAFSYPHERGMRVPFALFECSWARLREENEVNGCRDFGKLVNPNAGRIPGSEEVSVDQTAG